MGVFPHLKQFKVGGTLKCGDTTTDLDCSRKDAFKKLLMLERHKCLFRRECRPFKRAWAFGLICLIDCTRRVLISRWQLRKCKSRPYCIKNEFFGGIDGAGKSFNKQFPKSKLTMIERCSRVVFLKQQKHLFDKRRGLTFSISWLSESSRDCISSALAADCAWSKQEEEFGGRGIIKKECTLIALIDYGLQNQRKSLSGPISSIVVLSAGAFS